MKSKASLNLIKILIIIITYIFLIWKISYEDNHLFFSFSDYEFTTHTITFILFNIVLGFIMGVDGIIKMSQSIGRWSFSVLRFSFIGGPLIFASLGYYMYYTYYNIGFFRKLFFIVGIIHMLITESAGGGVNAALFLLLFSCIAQIILGYSIATCFKKG